MRKILPATALNIFILFLSSVTHAQLLDTVLGPRVWFRSEFGTDTPLKYLSGNQIIYTLDDLGRVAQIIEPPCENVGGSTINCTIKLSITLRYK